jgi:hypothetical protein
MDVKYFAPNGAEGLGPAKGLIANELCRSLPYAIHYIDKYSFCKNSFYKKFPPCAESSSDDSYCNSPHPTLLLSWFKPN